MVQVEAALGAGEIALHVIDQCRRDADGPGFFLTKVEVEVCAEAGGPGVGVSVAIHVVVQPSGAGYGFNLKEARFACISAKQIYQVHLSKKADVGGIEGGFAVRGIDISHTLDSQSEDGSQLFAKFNTQGRAGILEECAMGDGGNDAGSKSYGPIVCKFATLYSSLCIRCECHCYKS